MKTLFCAVLTVVFAWTYQVDAAGLQGMVVDETGEPVVDAKVDVVGFSENTLTDSQGDFQLNIENVDELHIEASGFSHKVLHLHGESSEPITVTLRRTVMEQVDVVGLPLHRSTIESAQPIAVLSGEELRGKQASTLGETLKNEISVHSTYFGPVASSPIIRGLDGPRVLVAQNGLDVSDASRVGSDHVVATEATTAQQIEILRGPATLFYGSGAIGGVVNIIDDRVPSSSESKVGLSIQHNTVADENDLSAFFTGGSNYVAVHVDGFWRDGDDYKIPGEAILETEEEHEEEGHEEHAEGILENSASEGQGFNIGGSLLFDRGFVGLSYGRLERTYGVLGHTDHHEEEEEEEHEDEEELEDSVIADLEQDRWQLINEWQLDGEFLSEINTRMGYTDYEHAEIHGGVPETVFSNKTLQVRTDLLHQEFAGWRGAFSLESKNTDFEAVGEEAFTPPSETEQLSFALMEEKHDSDVLWQLGFRIEQVELTGEPLELGHDDHEGEEGEEEHELIPFDSYRYTPISLSAGFVWDFMEGYNIGVAVTRAERAPSASELFSAGPHIGSGSYEVGVLLEIHQEGSEYHIEYSGDADIETSRNIDISLRKFQGDFGFVLNAFYNQVDNYYFQRNTGLLMNELAIFSEEEEEPEGEEEHEHEHAEDLPVYVFEQSDADFYGLEAEFVWRLTPVVQMKLWGDSIRARLDDGGFLPRIPPLRLGSQFSLSYRQWDANISAVHYFEQDNIADNETSTDAYTMLDAQVSYYLEPENLEWVLFAKVNNITDEEARVHSSFLKDEAPLPGRGFAIGLRVNF